jgi:hypothetical protein
MQELFLLSSSTRPRSTRYPRKLNPRHSDQAPLLHVPQEIQHRSVPQRKGDAARHGDAGCDVSSTLSHITLYQLHTTNTSQAALLPLLILPLLTHLRLPNLLLVSQI